MQFTFSPGSPSFPGNPAGPCEMRKEEGGRRKGIKERERKGGLRKGMKGGREERMDEQTDKKERGREGGRERIRTNVHYLQSSTRLLTYHHARISW